jgi:transcriptional regulator with XRE-family HTH domain
VETVGRKLQRARLARKIEIEEVAKATKIRPDRIVDLEEDEYGHFPNLFYAKSFLAKYAKFLGVDIQELDNFWMWRSISLGDYHYLSLAPPLRFVLAKQTLEAKGYRVPPLVVAALVLVLVVGVPLLSYLSLNTSRLGGSEGSAAVADVQNKLAEAAPTPPGPVASSMDLLQPLDQLSPADEKAAVASLAAPHNRSLKEEATPTPYGARIENGVEVRRALPVDPMQNSAAPEPTASPDLSTLPEKKLEVGVLRRAWLKVTTDERGTQPVFEGSVGPQSRPIVIGGKRFWVQVLDKGAIEVRKEGQLVPGSSDDNRHQLN